jgi:hypothetical protein
MVTWAILNEKKMSSLYSLLKRPQKGTEVEATYDPERKWGKNRNLPFDFEPGIY